MNNQKLKNYMDITKTPQKEVANKLGVSVATVSLYLRGEYDGNVEELDIKVEQFLARQKDKVLDKQLNAAFVPTFRLAVASGYHITITLTENAPSDLSVNSEAYFVITKIKGL